MANSKWRVNVVEIDALSKDSLLVDSIYFKTMKEANAYIEEYNNEHFMQDMDSDTYRQVQGPFRV